MSSSPTQGKDPREPQLPQNPCFNDLTLQGIIFYNFSLLISFLICKSPTPLFLQNRKIQTKFTILTSLKSFLRRKLIPVFDPRPLYCSSLATEVGGNLGLQILLIPDHPTVARIKGDFTRIVLKVVLYAHNESSSLRDQSFLLEFTTFIRIVLISLLASSTCPLV